MKRDRGPQAFEFFVLMIVLSFVVGSFNYVPRARLIPLLVGFSTLLMILALLVNDIHPVSILKKIDVDWTEKLRLQDLSRQRTEKVGVKKFLVVSCWSFGFFLSILLFGFSVSITLYTFFYLKIQGNLSVIKALLTAGLTWATAFVVFEWAMGLELFEGVVFGEIIPPL